MYRKVFKPRVGKAAINNIQRIVQNGKSKQKGMGIRVLYFILAYAYAAVRVEDSYGQSFWSQNQWDGEIVGIPISKKDIGKWFGTRNHAFYEACTKLKGLEVSTNRPYDRFIYFDIPKGLFLGAIKEVDSDEPLSYVSYLEGEESLPWQHLYLLKCIQASCQKEQTLNFDTVINYGAFKDRKDKQTKSIMEALDRFKLRGYLKYEVSKDKIKITPLWREEVETLP